LFVNEIDGHALSGDITMNGNDVVLAGNAQTATITTSGGSAVTVNNNLSMSGNNITSANNITSTNIDTTTLDAGNVNVTGNTVSSTGFLEFKSGSSERVTFKADNGILSIENTTSGGDVELEFAQLGDPTFSINKNSSRVDICQSGLNNLELTTDCFSGSDKKVIFDPVASGGTGDAQFRDYNLDMNSNDISDVGNLEVTTVNDLTSVGGIYSGISDGATILPSLPSSPRLI